MDSDSEFDESQHRLNQPPFCSACGVPVKDEEDLSCYNFFHEGRKMPVLWTAIYRVVFREQCEPDYQNQQSFHLSGVSRLYYHVDPRPPLYKDRLWGKVFSVPRDKEGVVTNKRSHMIGKDGHFRDVRMVIYPANFWDKRHRDLYPHGFPIHAHCWTMIERVIGQRAEDELDLFLEVLHQRWKTKPRPFELRNCVKNRFWYGLHYEIDTTVELRAVWDPMDVPEVRAVIRRCTLRSSKRRSSSPQSLGTLDLPLDILLHIVDYLLAADIESFITATQWQAPDSYWRSRFPRKLIFEIEELVSNQPEKADWQFLYLEVEKLLANERLNGLQNRQRIFRILEGTKELFLSRMLA